MNGALLITAVFCTVVSFVIGVLLARIFPYFGSTMTTSDWAAWVQALGSIGAIVAAFLVGKQQAKAALRAVVDANAIDALGRRRSIVAIAEAALERASGITDAVLRYKTEPVALYEVYDLSVIAGMVEALTKAPAHEMGSRDGVLALLALRDQIRFFGEAVEKFRKPPVDDADLETLLQGLDGSQVSMILAQRKEILVGNVKQQFGQIERHFAVLKKQVAPQDTKHHIVDGG